MSSARGIFLQLNRLLKSDIQTLIVKLVLFYFLRKPQAAPNLLKRKSSSQESEFSKRLVNCFIIEICLVKVLATSRHETIFKSKF